VIELDAKIAADAPKVAFAEAVRAIDGACHIGKIAKALGHGQNKFFKRLRADGILLDNNLPYQKYIDREYFTVIEQQPYTDSKGVTHATFTTMVTGAGQVFLAKRYANIAGAPMRDYGKVSPKFWIGPTGQGPSQAWFGSAACRPVPADLPPRQHARDSTTYREAFMAHETGLGFEGASKGLQGCVEAGFCLLRRRQRNGLGHGDGALSR
jgi:phage antirepressor YoqD-like protein